MSSPTLLFAFALFVAVSNAATTTYSTKYDNVDLDSILKSDRLLNNYYKCLMDEGPCTPDGQELKKSIPDALKNKCEPCTAGQREGIEKVLRHLTEKQPDSFLALEKKYDPEGLYRKTFGEEAKTKGINLPERKD